MSQSSSFEPVGIAPGFATVPPTASRPPGLGESSLNGAPQWETDDGPKGRRKSSVPYPPPVRPPNHRNSSSGMSVIHTSPNPMHGEDEIEPEERKKARSSSSGSTPVLTSCEACRKGKYVTYHRLRRIKRSKWEALTPKTTLPCARCRRFALECVRMRVSRRKGPAPVDLSAISDAAYGYGQNSASISDSSVDVKPNIGASSSSGPVSTEAAPAVPIPLPSPSFPLLTASSPNVDIAAIPSNLDMVVSQTVVDNIIGLFFDYVYPLTPCLHRPTFLADLAARRDKTDPIFFALTLCVLASTLVQVPRNLVSLKKEEVESLARRCVRVARAKVGFIWDDPVPMRSEYVVIFYLEGIVHLLLGNNTAHVIVTAQANQCALAMRLNEESSYEGLNPIESEIRRRIYWLLFQADKSTACMRSRTICLRLDDAPNLSLPTEVDDEQITPNGILPQPIGRTPTITGFNIVTNLFRILNDALLLQRRLKGAATSIESILADLGDVNMLRDRVINATSDVASPLRVRSAYDSRAASPQQGWEANMQARFMDFFSGVTSDNNVNSFMVMQGNILVTQQVVRLVLLQTREHLLAQLSLATQMPQNGVGGLAGMPNNESAEDIACDLLDGLNSLPEECVATNGPSLVQKVRFVAIQLMEGSTSYSPQAVRAQSLLMQFLNVLSVIEGMYSFGRDVSVE